MANTYWLKQTPDKPLFPDLLWSRPENKQAAGKLLIIGGNVHGFSAVGEAFLESQKAGIGSVRVLLPDALQKIVGTHFETAEFAPSTPSGSFSQTALGHSLEMANWADGVLIAGDLARNSETAIWLEKFLAKYQGLVTLTKDAADYALNILSFFDRPGTLLVISVAQLQKLFIKSGETSAITFDMDLLNLVDMLHEFTNRAKLSIVVKHYEQIIAAVNGQVSTTRSRVENEEMWRVKTATNAVVWWLQNPAKTFEAVTTSLLE